jgi:hypothetical protein
MDVVRGVTQVTPVAWDALGDPDDPFTEHAFLATLEESGSVGPGTGWAPRFVLAYADGVLAGAVPAYRKEHGFGEFIFDFAWAHAAERAGLAYYPKLVAAVPFTPATGPRLLVRGDLPAPLRSEVTDALGAGLLRLMRTERASSVHALFCRPAECEALLHHGFVRRASLQFHWTNRAPEPFADFDDWLGVMSSRHRKELRKERRIAASHGLRLETRSGAELDGRAWEALERFYRCNANKHDNVCYLTPAFFALARTRLATRVLATLAWRGDEAIAGTLNFERGRCLYGRYWGCVEELDRLHFELCYHRLIERGIAQRHARVEAGAGGEHKLARGLLPALTWSSHFIADPRLAAGVRHFVVEEARAVEDEAAQYQALSPLRKGPGGASARPTGAD